MSGNQAHDHDIKKNPSTEFREVADLTPEEARGEIEALREGIEFHDHKYYVEDEPVIADSVYDKLFHRLQELEEAFPQYQSENSPTRRVGAAPLDELQRVRHRAPMLSLDAALKEEEFEEFHDFVQRRVGRKSVEYVLEPKFDGVSVEIVYREGGFQSGSTRGDGNLGEDITANLRTIRTLPLRLPEEVAPAPKLLALRAEVFIPLDNFQRINRERIRQGDEPYANPRNAAAGIVRRLESTEVARHHLEIFFYDILEIEGQEFDTHWEELKQFSVWGLKTEAHNQRASSKQDVAAYHQKLSGTRDDLNYEIDGIVIKVNDKQLWPELGTRQRSPRWALAWKFSPRQEITTLEEIVVQVGRTGKLTPVALLQPVDVGGVTVSRATLHNEGEVRKKDVRPGDRVRVSRAGDVIPEVVERIEQPGKQRSKAFRMPEKCPVCGTRIVQEGANHFCPAGLSCPPQLIGHILHYGSREALDIAQLGERTARELVKTGRVRNLADLYELSIEDLLQLEGFARKSARKLHDAIQKTRRPPLDRFLYGLGIQHVGRSVAGILAQEFKSLEALEIATRDKLSSLPGIGPQIVGSLRSFFDSAENRKILKRLRELGLDVQEMPSGSRKKNLEGMKFVFTGTLENFTRSEAGQAVERLGGTVTSSVSGETDYLVVGKEPGSKLERAKQEQVEILDEEGFQKLLRSSE